MTDAAFTLRRTGGALFGPLVWAAHFLIVYGSESLFCRLSDGRAHTWLVAVASLIALALILGDLAVQRKRSRQDCTQAFITRLRLGLDGLSGFAVLLVTATGLALRACGV